MNSRVASPFHAAGASPLKAQRLLPVRQPTRRSPGSSCSSPSTSTGTSADRSGSAAEGYRHAPHSVAGWIVEVVAVPAFPLGAWACLAIARGWPHGKMQRAAAIVVWLGCAVLSSAAAPGSSMT